MLLHCEAGLQGLFHARCYMFHVPYSVFPSSSREWEGEKQTLLIWGSVQTTTLPVYVSPEKGLVGAHGRMKKKFYESWTLSDTESTFPYKINLEANHFANY